MLLTTEQSPALAIDLRLGIVSGQCVLGLNIFRDITALFKDLTGRRLGTAEMKYAEARESVIAQLKGQAEALGADAVIAIQFSHGELTGGDKAMLTCSAVGTAVKLERLVQPF